MSSLLSSFFLSLLAANFSNRQNYFRFIFFHCAFVFVVCFLCFVFLLCADFRFTATFRLSVSLFAAAESLSYVSFHLLRFVICAAAVALLWNSNIDEDSKEAAEQQGSRGSRVFGLLFGPERSSSSFTLHRIRLIYWGLSGLELQFLLRAK